MNSDKPEQPQSSSPGKEVNRLVILPSLVTFANALLGLMAIGEIFKALQDKSIQHLEYASWFILLAMICDALDGKVARMTGSSSSFGVELDSLCDGVSFGVAPALLVYASILQLRALGSPHPFLEKLSFPAAALYLFCVLVRLARFNVEKDLEAAEHGDFVGLPTPAAAGTIAAGFLMTLGLTQMVNEPNLPLGEAVLGNPFKIILQLAPWVLVLLALLMVSRITYPHILDNIFSRETSFWKTMGAIVVVSVILVEPEISLFLIFSLYVISGLLNELRRWIVKFVN